MKYYLYRITNLVNGKIYVGVHKTKNESDGYMGSGKVIKAAIAKHGVENFQKEILEYFDSAAEMYEREKEFVTQEFLDRDDVYNLRRGGFGGFDYINSYLTSEDRKRFGSMTDTSHGNKESARLFRLDPSRQQQLKDARKNSSAFKGKIHTEATKEKMRKSKNVGISNSQYGTFWITNGNINRKCLDTIPEGWKRGRTMKK